MPERCSKITREKENQYEQNKEDSLNEFGGDDIPKEKLEPRRTRKRREGGVE